MVRSLYSILLLVVLLAVITGAVGAQAQPDLLLNKQLVLDFIEVVFNNAEVTAAGDYASEDYLQNTPNVPSGLEALQGMVMGIHSAFPDIQYTVYEIAAENDLVAARIQITGTQEGEFMGIPATERAVSASTINFWRVEDGKLAEHWEVVDQLTFLQQLGVIPSAGEQPLPIIADEPVTEAVMSSATPEENEATYDIPFNLYITVLNAQDLSDAEDYIVEDVVWNNPFVGPGLEGFTNFYTGIFEAFPDVEREIILTVTEGDTSFVYSTITGRHEGGEQLYGVPPTGNSIRYDSADIFRIEDDKIVEIWDVGDYVTLFGQIGLLQNGQ